jgi:uncharacterized protein (TIGR02231 family)
MKLTRLALLGLALFPGLRLAAAPVDSRITAVTVYADRAVVTRTASVELAAGQTELVFANLPEALLDQSLQVSGRGAGAAMILDVSARRTYVDFTPNARVAELEQQLRVLRADDRQLADEAGVLAAQREAVNKFIQGAVSPGGKDTPRPQLADVRATLEFGQQQLVELARALQQLDTRRETLADKISALERQLGELRGAGGRAFKTVTVRVAAEQAGRLEVALSYAVGGARWSPGYDARVLSGDRAVALGYFGVVRQSTGEDWKDVALTLSTARPSLGGSAPELGRWEVDVWRDEVVRLEQFAVSGSAARAKATMAAPAAEMRMAERDSSQELHDAAMAAATIEAGATSASFRIATTTTIPSDGSAQKVPIASARLAAAFNYATTPKLQPTAFLTTQVTNTTDFPLLAGPLNVFLDGTFVATSRLKTVMPAEKFDLALGADEGIAVKHERLQRFVENTGLMNSGTRTTYEYRITLQNNKPTPERIVVNDQLPLSRHEKIVVRQLVPTERELKPDADGKLKWTLDLKPGEKREITVKFTVEHANDVNVAGLE